MFWDTIIYWENTCTGNLSRSTAIQILDHIVSKGDSIMCMVTLFYDDGNQKKQKNNWKCRFGGVGGRRHKVALPHFLEKCWRLGSNGAAILTHYLSLSLIWIYEIILHLLSLLIHRLRTCFSRHCISISLPVKVYKHAEDNMMIGGVFTIKDLREDATTGNACLWCASLNSWSNHEANSMLISILQSS